MDCTGELKSTLNDAALEELRFDIGFYGIISLTSLSAGIILFVFAMLSLPETKKFIVMLVPTILSLIIASLMCAITSHAYEAYDSVKRAALVGNNIKLESINDSFSKIVISYSRGSVDNRSYTTQISNSRLPKNVVSTRPSITV